jgi:hypothetical protein
MASSCASQKDNLEVECALKSKTNPIGVAEYQLKGVLPARLKGKLPTAAQLQDVIRETLPARPLPLETGTTPPLRHNVYMWGKRRRHQLGNTMVVCLSRSLRKV